MVKVELQKNEKNGSVKLAFETNKDDELEIVDLVRIAILGDHTKRGGYAHSKRLIIEVDNVLKKLDDEPIVLS